MLVSLHVLRDYGDTDAILYVLFGFTCLAIINSLAEIAMERLEYVFDFWNWVDVGANVFTMMY